MESRIRLLGFWLLVCVLCIGCGETEERDYTFFLNGKAVSPKVLSLSGDSDSPQSGDVIGIVFPGSRVYGLLFLTLGEEKACHFVTIPEKPGCLFLKPHRGRPRVVGVVIDEQHSHVAGPLTKLPPSEINGLWGIRFNWPTEDVAESLKHINADCVCITLAEPACSILEREGVFSTLPATLRYLVVEDFPRPPSLLAKLDQLVLLALQVGPKEEFDLRLVSRNKRLRYADLQVSGGALVGTDEWAKLTGLRVLDLSGCEQVHDIEFVRGMSQLRVLGLGRTGVSDLSPLDQSNSIRELDVRATSVRRLPAGELPALRRLNVVASQVEDETLERFRQEHPQCVIDSGWK